MIQLWFVATLFSLIFAVFAHAEGFKYTFGAILRQKEDAHLRSALNFAVHWLNANRPELGRFDLKVRSIRPGDHYGAILNMAMTDTPAYDLSKGEFDLQRYFIYQAIEEDDRKILKGKCRKCSQDCARNNGGTTAMLNHLEKCDKTAYDVYKSGKKPRKNSSAPITPRTIQPTIASSFKALDKWKDNDPRAIAQDKAILKWMCANLEPLDSVEGLHFDGMMPDKYRVKGRTFMTKLLEDEYAIEFGKLLKRLEMAEHIAFTTDTWASKNSERSFISFTAHWIDSKFDRHTDLIFCKPLDCPKTGENLAKILCEAFEEAQIPTEKRHLLVRDAAANMKKTAKQANLPSIDCFIHKLQLAVSDALKPFEEDLKNARKIPSLYNRSSNFRKAFKETSKQMGIEPKALKQDIKTRWDSTYSFLKRLIEFRTIIGALSTGAYDGFDEDSDMVIAYNLPTLNFERLQKLVDALEPFAEYTKQLSSRDASIAEILPVYYSIKAMLNSELTLDPNETCRVEQVAAQRLTDRMTEMEKSPYLLVASALDPRIKSCLYTSDQKTAVRAQLIEELKLVSKKQSDQSVPSEIEDPEPPTKLTKLSISGSRIQQMLNASKQQQSIAEDSILLEAEVDAYLRENVIDYDEDRSCIYSYWKSTQFKSLKEVARKYLAPPPSSVESERVFSTLGNIYTDKRNRLSSDHAHMQLFLSYIYKQ